MHNTSTDLTNIMPKHYHDLLGLARPSTGVDEFLAAKGRPIVALLDATLGAESKVEFLAFDEVTIGEDISLLAPS